MSIFTHVVVGTNDLEKARIFFDEVFGSLGFKRQFDGDTRAAWGVNAPSVMVTKPLDGQPATSANGGTIGLVAPNRKAVDDFHAAALANGGTCDGPPGLRPPSQTAYGAYIRDPDGNKFCAFCSVSE